MSEYTYYMETNFSEYIGQWVAIVNEEVVAHGKNAKDVYDRCRKLAPTSTPFMFCVPEKMAMIL